MRIFHAVPGTANYHALPSSKIWHTNLYLPLLDLGHELVPFESAYSDYAIHQDPAVPEHRGWIDRHRPRFSEELVRQVRAAHRQKPLALFFSYFYSAYVEPDAIREIGRMGIPTVNWYCNASYQFHLVEEIAPAYSYCLVPEKHRLADYRRIGANPIYCQEAANPNFYYPCDVPVEYDVTFVGQKYGNRPAALCALLKAGVDARVWGPNWQGPPPQRSWQQEARYAAKRLLGRPAEPRCTVPLDRCGPPLSDEELVKMYSRSRISLGFTTLAAEPTDGAPNKQVRLRDFEATMSGAFYMVEHFDELTEFFVPDREIVTWRTPDELVEKCRYYLRHEGDRQRIREAALRRARSEHTWHRRFEMVFEKMGLS